MRFYATVPSGGSPSIPDDYLSWPEVPSPGTAVPTPYQILCIKRGDPYSKNRFLELAKLYHPDRSRHEHRNASIGSLSGAVKMERYRMVVAAHEILSDSKKRSAYDKTGAGWNGCPDHEPPTYRWGHDQRARWSGFDTNDSPFQNATWEDWERWYQRDKAKQEPVYFSNGGFLMLVVTAVFLGGFSQSIRVGDYSNLFQRQVEMVHNDASKALQQRKTDSTGFGNRDERLHNFLRSRDPQGYGVADPPEDAYRKLLSDPEACMRDGTHYRSHEHNTSEDTNQLTKVH